MRTNKRKIIGLSCGRKNGNSEILLKEACMGAEELGVESEIIRAMDLRIKPCKGCEACTIAFAAGKEPRCAQTDDDVPWILEKTCVEDCGLIVSVPTYHLRANGYFEILCERLLPTLLSNLWINKKTRVGGIICVGGGELDWTPLTRTTVNIFVQESRLVVDQIQVNGATAPGSVLVNEKALERARELGRNVARAMMMPIEEVKFMGDETAASCPVCHCNVLQVPDDSPHVVCPVCDVHGVISVEGGRIKVKWNEEDVKHPRFSEYGVSKHMEEVGMKQGKFFGEDQAKAKELIKKYISYGKIIKP